METVKNLQVVVKNRITKVVDKSRQTTLVSPKIEIDKKIVPKQIVKNLQPKHIISKQIAPTKVTLTKNKPKKKKKQIKVVQEKGNNLKNERSIERVIIPLTPQCPHPAQSMYPRFPLRPPAPGAPPFPVIPAGAPPVVDPVTKQVLIPAFIPVTPGAPGMPQTVPHLPPFPGPPQVDMSNSDLNQGRTERKGYDTYKRDDKYHSSELDYFLGGTSQYLNEKSQRKRSRSFSNRSASSANTRSDTFNKRKRYSPDRKSRSSVIRSRSYRSYERDGSQRSRRHSEHSGSRSGSIYGTKHYSRSPFRSVSRDRSLSPPVSGGCHLKSNSRSPVSENSFRGSFLTVSEANSRDSVRDVSREHSRSRYSGHSFVEEPYVDTEQVSDYEGNYSRSRHSDNYFSPRHTYSQERERSWDRSPSHTHDRRENDKYRHVSPGYDAEMYRDRTPEHSSRHPRDNGDWREYESRRDMSPGYDAEKYRDRTPEHSNRPRSHGDEQREYDRTRHTSHEYDTRHSSRPPSHHSDWREHDKSRDVSSRHDRESYHRTPERSRDRDRHRSAEFERVIRRDSEGEKIEYIHHYDRVVERDGGGESIRYIKRQTHREPQRQQRHHSRQYRRHSDIEKVSDFEDVSDFEEVSEYEEVSDNEGSVTWDEAKSDISYEVISDSEEPVVKSEVKDNDEVMITGIEPGGLTVHEAGPINDHELDEVSDNEMQFNDTDPQGNEVGEVKNVSDSATAFIKDVLAGLPSNNTNQQLDNNVTQSFDNKVTNQEPSGSAGDWNAVSGSAIQVYANLGLIKDENNKLVYVGQSESNEMNSTLPSQNENMAYDESFQGYVRTLWQFPHKGVLHMSYTSFIEESEAYKDELIAEIIHIILRLDLPYVTLNKLRKSIRENVKIQMLSVEELKQILLLYPKHFILVQHAGSDTDDDDDPEVQTSKIRVTVKNEIRLCERHKALPFNVNECPCDSLHICPFYLLSSCNRSSCSLGHDLKTPHNAEVIKDLRFHRATLIELVEYMRNVDHRNLDTVPTICKFYNRRRGCAKDSESDDDELCLDLHLCFFYVMDTCRKGEECELTHDFKSGQPQIVLQKYGLDPKVLGEFNILSMLRSSLRARRQVLDSLNEKITEKSLTESEIKLCISRGINPKMLQMTKGLRSHPLIAATVQDMDKKDNENQDTSKLSSPVLSTSEESVTKKPRTSLSKQMQAQKALIEKALDSMDEGNEFTNQGDPRAVIPIICKFYNNETGCARSNEYCEFIHVCHHYVMGDCKYYDRCKRSHDLTSGQPENILSRLGIVNMSEEEIIKVLRKLCGETLVGVDM